MFGILSHREGMHRLKPVQACCFLWSSFYWSFSFHTLCWAMCTLSPRWSCKIKKTFTLFWLTQGKLSESADPLSWSRKLSKQKLFICVEMSSLRCNSCGHSLHSSLSFMSPHLPSEHSSIVGLVHHSQAYEAKELIRGYQQLPHRLQLTNTWKQQNWSNAIKPIQKNRVRLHLKVSLYVILEDGEQKEKRKKQAPFSSVKRIAFFF